MSFLVEQRDERVAGFLRLMIPVAVTLAAFLSVIGVPPAFAQVDVEDWPGTVEVRVTGKTQGLTTGDVFTYQLRLTEPPTEEGWWVRIRADGVVYMEGIYNGLSWVPSIGWEFSPQNYNQWRDVRVRVNEDLDQTVTFSHEVWAHNGICPVHDVGRVAVDVSGDAPPPEEDLPRLSIADAATVTEGGAAVFTVTLSDTSSETVTVRYATVDDTAVAGSDYTRTTGTLRFDPNERTDTIRVPILQDSTAEPSESFTVELSNPNRATVSDGTGAVTIEADPMPELRISDAAPVAEGNDAVFTVSLSTPSSQVVTVEYRTVDGTAGAGSDYSTTSETLRFDPLETTKTIQVPVLTDSMSEPSEDFEVELRNPSRATLDDARGVGTIAADPMPGLTIDDAAPVAEGNDAVFTVTLHPQSSQVVTVEYTTADGTANAGDDYTTIAETLTFSPGQTTKIIRVPVLVDSTQESSETFTVELSTPMGTTLADSTGLGTITADPMPGLSIGDAEPVAEGGAAVFTVTLSDTSSETVTVRYATVDDTAVAGSDYTRTTGTLRFDPNERTDTIRVPILQDSTAEPSESFTVELSNPNRATVSDGTGAVTIEADPMPELRISDAAPVAEGNDAVFTVSLSTPSSQVVTVEYRTVDGTAGAGSDYSTTSETLRFDPLETTKTIQVPVLTDSMSEPSEDFEVELRNPSRATLDDARGVGTIAADPMPGLTIDDAAPVAEGNDAVFTVTLHPQSSQVVTVEYTTADGTANAGDDYTTIAETLTFSPGQTTKIIRVPVLVDSTQESSETFTVELSTPMGTTLADSTGLGTITADPMPGLSIGDAEPVAEGGAAVFTVTLGPASNHVVTVTYSTVDGTAVADADFTPTSGTLTFNPNQTTKTIRVPILRDTVHEPSETFTVELDDPTGTTLADSTGLGTIAADATPGLSIADAVNVAEGRDAVFRVTLRPATNHVVSVTYTTMDGTAVADADYTPVTGTLRFEPRETTKTIRVPVLLDTMTEQSETFTVELSNPGGSTLADPIGVGTIRADPAPSLRIGDATPVAEGDEAVFTVTLTPPNEQVVTVDYTTTDGTAVADEDYSATSGTLRFAPGDTSKTIRVPTLRDAVAEPVETFTVVLSNPSGTNVVHDTGVGTITDEGLPGLSSADAPTVAEGGEAVFPVTLNPASSQVVTVAYATQDDTAVADSDYTATSGTLRFEPGETIQNIQVATLRDAIAEPSESFTVELSDPVGTAITNSTGVGTIAADAMPALSITDAVPVAEGGEATFMVSLSPASSELVTVAYATQDGTAVADSDYTATSGTLRFEPGETIQNIQVATLRDAIAEPSESFTVELSDPVGTAITNSTGVGTIAADAMPALSITDAVPVAEGGEATFMVSLSPASSELVTVAYATQDGTAVADSDYTATSGTLRFEPGETIQNIQVATLRDAIAEPSESFTVELSDPVGTAITNSTGVGTIAADAMPALSITDAVPVAEGGEATFMVSLSPASSELVTVAYATQDGTAVAGSDYTAASGTLQFDPGMTSHTISVAVLNDTAVEPTETFAVELSDPVRATLADGTGVGTITDDVEHRVERTIRTGFPEVGRAIAFSAVTCRIDRKMSDTRTWDNAGRLAGGGFPPAANFGGHAAFGGPGTTFGGSTGAFGDSPFPTQASMTPGQQLGNRSFLMASQETAEGGGGRVAAWGCGDYRRLSGAGGLGAGSWNGEVYSLHVGVDVRLGSNVLAGVSISRSTGMIDYEGGLGSGTDGGEHDLRLVGVHPFLGWSVTPGLQLWGTVGHAWGELRIVDELRGLTGAATLNSGALGLNGRLLTRGATTLSLRGEGALAQLTADSATFEVATLDMWRFRLTTELSHELLFSSGTSLTPWAELGARHDGGDGQTGAGLELGGGLRYRVPQVGLTAEGYGRWLAVHEGALQEWGVGAMVTIDPGMDRRGLSASVTPSWGETASGVQRLWQQGAAGPAWYGTSRAQVDAQLGYGVPVFGGRSVLTPFGAMNLAGDEARRYRLGGSLATSRWTTLSLEIERWDRALTDAMYSVMVRGAAEF